MRQQCALLAQKVSCALFCIQRSVVTTSTPLLHSQETSYGSSDQKILFQINVETSKTNLETVPSIIWITVDGDKKTDFVFASYFNIIPQ